MKALRYLFALSIIFAACQPQQKWPNEALHGEWDTISWINTNNQQPIKGQLDFNFKNDGRYVLDYGSKQVEGKYWIEGEFLHTIEDQQSEMKVKILTLTKDSLKIDMNRGGRMEQVILMKK